MSTTENGWTKEFPEQAGFFFIRDRTHGDIDDVIRTIKALGSICAYRTSTDRVLFKSDFRRHEFLGPFTAHDIEQLAALRKAAKDADDALQLIQGFDFALDSSAHGQEIRRRAIDAIAALREALKPEMAQGEKS